MFEGHHHLNQQYDVEKCRFRKRIGRFSISKKIRRFEQSRIIQSDFTQTGVLKSRLMSLIFVVGVRLALPASFHRLNGWFTFGTPGYKMLACQLDKLPGVYPCG